MQKQPLLKIFKRSFKILVPLLFSLNAFSANITFLEDRPFSQLLVQGEIVKGDYQKVLNLIKKHRDIPSHISLDSIGGNVLEALKIGTLTRKYLVRSDTQKCNSACVFILMGSLFENENTNAKYGIHRPKFNPQYFASLNMQEATVKYKRLYDIVSSYMYSMGATKALVDDMFSVPSGSMKFLNNQEFYAMMNTSSQGFFEWITAKCGNGLNKQEQLQLKAFQKNRSQLDKSYFAYLDAKSNEYFNCELESVRNEQMRIFSSDARFQDNQMSLKQ